MKNLIKILNTATEKQFGEFNEENNAYNLKPLIISTDDFNKLYAEFNSKGEIRPNLTPLQQHEESSGLLTPDCFKNATDVYF